MIVFFFYVSKRSRVRIMEIIYLQSKCKTDRSSSSSDFRNGKKLYWLWIVLYSIQSINVYMMCIDRKIIIWNELYMVLLCAIFKTCVSFSLYIFVLLKRQVITITRVIQIILALITPSTTFLPIRASLSCFSMMDNGLKVSLLVVAIERCCNFDT